MATLLDVQRVSKSFGGVTAVDDVTFTVDEATVTALIGPNGAGKTTLFNAMTGFGRPDSGTVTFAGTAVHGLAPHRVARLGMIRTFQSIRMLGGLTVYESLLGPGAVGGARGPAGGPGPGPCSTGWA